MNTQARFLKEHGLCSVSLGTELTFFTNILSIVFSLGQFICIVWPKKNANSTVVTFEHNVQYILFDLISSSVSDPGFVPRIWISIFF